MRIPVRIFALASFLASITALSAVAQDDELSVESVVDGIFMLTGNGGNIGVSAGADGFLMIDDKFAPLADQIRDALHDLGEGDLAFLLNTHYHGDHTGANEVFGIEAPILAHHNVRVRLATKPAPAATLPVVTFAEGLSVHFNGEEIRVAHFPHAHTDGDAVVFFTGANVVHMGDILFNRRFPFVDIDAGGSLQGVIDAVEAILARVDDDTRIIPGHGPLATRDDLRTYLRMLKETSAVVTAGVRSGESLEDLQAAGVGDEWSDWSWGFITTERWIATLYRAATEQHAAPN